MSRFGDTIKQLRIAQQLELRATAHLLGITPVYLSRIERGKEPPPDQPLIRAMAKALAADPDVLLSLCPAGESQINTLLEQNPNIRHLIQLLLDRELSDDQVRKVEKFIRREILKESSVSTV